MSLRPCITASLRLCVLASLRPFVPAHTVKTMPAPSNKTKPVKKQPAMVTSQPAQQLIDFAFFIKNADLLSIGKFCNFASSTPDGLNLKLFWQRAFSEGHKLGRLDGYDDGYSCGYLDAQDDEVKGRTETTDLFASTLDATSQTELPAPAFDATTQTEPRFNKNEAITTISKTSYFLTDLTCLKLLTCLKFLCDQRH